MSFPATETSLSESTSNALEAKLSTCHRVVCAKSDVHLCSSPGMLVLIAISQHGQLPAIRTSLSRSSSVQGDHYLWRQGLVARDAPLQNSVFTSTATAQQFSLVSFHLASSAVFQVPPHSLSGPFKILS